jgi:uncharacterized OsmC-like protein
MINVNNNQSEVNVKLTNQKVQFSGVSKTNPNHPIVFDYLPPLGDGQGYKGLELLLMSFAGCVSTTIVYLLRKMGKNVSGFTIKAIGINRAQPLSLQKIDFEAILESSDASDLDLKNAILQAEKLSPVWVTCKNDIEVNTKSRVIKVY